MGNPLEVGITGGIGAGKSLVCKIFKCLGVPVYDADSRAKKLMTTDGILVGQIKEEFGTLSYQPDGSLDRAHISKVAFDHPEKLKRLNSLVHPRVAVDYKTWVEAHIGSSYLLRESALLFEAGLQPALGKMIVVTASEDLRIKRVLLRDSSRSEEGIRSIMKSQWPEEDKLKRADYVIFNDDQQLVIPQVLQLHQKLIS